MNLVDDKEFMEYFNEALLTRLPDCRIERQTSKGLKVCNPNKDARTKLKKAFAASNFHSIDDIFAYPEYCDYEFYMLMPKMIITRHGKREVFVRNSYEYLNKNQYNIARAICYLYKEEKIGTKKSSFKYKD